MPNLTRLLQIKKGENILDLGCGEGYFSHTFAKIGARITGVDNSKKLIELAKKSASKNEEYYAWSADDLRSLKDASFDKATVVLAIQNIDNIHKVFAECRRVLKKSGRLYLVMNHPAFRIPKASDWGWDPTPNQTLIKPEESRRLVGDGAGEKMFRKIYEYMSESKTKIQMHPSHKQVMRGTSPGEYTISFHRPLQLYFKLLKNSGFAMTNLEEWISPKRSEPGPRAQAEDKARKEIPMFLFLEAVKL